MQSLNQLQLVLESAECGLTHLAELGIQLDEEITPELESWCNSIDPNDESTFPNHLVLHQQPMSDPIDLVRMRVMSAMVREQSRLRAATLRHRSVGRPLSRSSVECV